MKRAIIFGLIGLTLMFFQCLFSIVRSNKRHKRYIASADRVLNKIAMFEGATREARTLAYLRKIRPYVFEELLLTALERKGFKIERNRRYSGDGGIDGRATRNGLLYLIQAKRYKSYVSKKHIEEFAKKVGPGYGLFIHTGRTGKETFEQYRDTKITIISGNRLIKLLETQKATDTVSHIAPAHSPGM